MQSYLSTAIIVMYIRSITSSKDTTFRGFKTPCRDTSPKCLQDSAQIVFSEFVRGMPSLGVEPLDPIRVETLNLTLSGGLNIEFSDAQTKGLRKCAINSANVSGTRFNVVLHCNFTTKGKYRSFGKMLMFPIDGNGDATIVCKNLKIECNVILGTTVRNGKSYLVLNDYDIRHRYEGQVFYKITNLFKGNPAISNMILEYMNQNWRMVAEEFGDPVVNLGVETVLKNVEK